MTMSNVGIACLDYYIPKSEKGISQLIDNIPEERIPDSFKSKEEYTMYIEYVLGLKAIRVEEHLKDYEMIAILIDNFFESNIVAKEEIDLLVVCRELHENNTGNIGQLLLSEKGLNNAFSLHLSGNQCCNIEIAIQQVSAMMQGSNSLNNVLLVSANAVSDDMDRIIDTYGIYGDGAGLVHLNKKPKLICLKSSVVVESKLYNTALNKNIVATHAKNITECIDKILISPEECKEISQVIIQNANAMLVTQCLVAKGIPKEKIFSENLSSYGHLDCMDFIINLKDYVSEIETNQKILTVGLGFNGMYTCSLFKSNYLL